MIVPIASKLSVAALCVALAACASTQGADSGLYAMPEDPARAMPPADADPSSAAELAEGALHLLNPARAGGPDFEGAARLCLLSAEMARLPTERQLRRSCYRVAARSALRSGEREIYLEAVDRWERSSARNERAAGELAIHLAIRDRLEARNTGSGRRLPPDIRVMLPPIEID
jgi:hypothetical protein